MPERIFLFNLARGGVLIFLGEKLGKEKKLVKLKLTINFSKRFIPRWN